MEENQNRQDLPQKESREDPGIMESIGSFPDFLIKKAPPRKNKP